RNSAHAHAARKRNRLSNYLRLKRRIQRSSLVTTISKPFLRWKKLHLSEIKRLSYWPCHPVIPRWGAKLGIRECLRPAILPSLDFSELLILESLAALGSISSKMSWLQIRALR